MWINRRTISVEIKEEILEELNKYRQYSGTENGGVFTGSIITENKYRISKISSPCTIKSISSNCGCVRDAEIANSFIEQDFKSSNRTRYYLGEWHTHPEDNPKPSSIDIQSLKDVFFKSVIVIDVVFLIIVGRKTNYYGYYDGYSMKEINVEII